MGTGDQKENKAEEQAAEATIEELTELSGQGNSSGWKFERDEIHERK